MNNKKIIVLIILIYFVTLITVGFIDRNSKSGYIVISNFGSFKCKNLNCGLASNNEISKLNKNDKMLDLYIEGEKKGRYYGNYSDMWNMFTENGKLVILPSFIGVSTNLESNLSLPEARKTTEEEKNEINKILNENNYNYDYKLHNDIVYDYDINKDGELDSFYFITNFNYDEYVENMFSLFYTKIDGKINVINFKYSSGSFDIPIYYNLGFININNQNSILINETYFDYNENTKVSIYKEKNHKLKKISSITVKDIEEKKDKEDYIFNFNNEFIKKMIKIGSIVGIIVLVFGGIFLFFKNKSSSSNRI